MNLTEWLKLGGYGLYVWPSFALAALTIALNVFWARQSVAEAYTAARRRLAALRGAA